MCVSIVDYDDYVILLGAHNSCDTMRVSCYGVMTYVKEVTVLWHNWGQGSVSAGQQGPGEEVHLCFSTEQNNLPVVGAP